MKYLIIGDTPKAGWLAGRFQQHSLDVQWWPRSTLSATTTTSQLSQRSEQHDFIQSIGDVPIVDDLESALDPVPEWIIFATPGWALGDIAFELIQRIAPVQFPSFLSLVDGVGPTEKLANYFGAERVIRGVVTARFDWQDEAHTQIGVRGHLDIVFGQHALAETLVETWTRTGLIKGDVLVADDTSLKWSNVLRLLPGNALAALMDCSPQDVYANPGLRKIEIRQLREAVQVIDALNIRLIKLPNINVPRLAGWIRYAPALLLKWALKSYLTPSSLRAELESGIGRSDAAYLNGAVAAQANANLPFSTPVNHALAVSVTDVAEGRTQWEQIQQNPAYLETVIRIMSRH
jgi:ketopantoate reductase